MKTPPLDKPGYEAEWARVRKAYTDSQQVKQELTDAVWDLADKIGLDREVAWLLLSDERAKPTETEQRAEASE